MKQFTSCIVLLATAVLPAQDKPVLARLVDAVAPSIVTVRVVAEVAMPAMMGGEKHEMKQETLGTIVDKSGLVLVPTGALDPGAQMSMMFGGEAEMESTVTSLKILIGDEAKELTGTVVAKDDKLGFSFVKISDLGDRVLAPLSFAQKGELAIGAEVYAVRRLPEAYDFAPIVVRNEVAGRIKKPRSAWVLGQAAEASSPVFTADGVMCGVVAQIEVAGQGEDQQSMMMHMLGGGGSGPMTFMVSPQVVANSIAQALEAAAKTPEKGGEKVGEKKDGDGR
ncbi:MAG TPA: hypothetical protein VFZ65_10260 [Planctomycetota bacterium]|nr:hypothetical protein [Planctomycetota bacterium]